MNEAKFRALVAQAIDSLPDEFRDALNNVEVVVRDWPADEELDYFEEREGLDEGEGDMLLMGLYQGVPLPDRDSQSLSGVLPDRITLFRKSIEEFCGGDKREMTRQIRLTFLHEIGHYFGLDDERLKEMGY